MTSFTTSTLNYPQLADTAIRRVRSNHAPTSTDNKNFVPGDEWLDSSANNWYKFCNTAQGVATWKNITVPFPSQFIVGFVNNAPFQTVQSAVDAVAAAGGSGTIYILPGIYVENLDLTQCINLGMVALNGDESAPLVQIVGTTTPMSAGNFVTWRISWASSGDIFFSTAAGTASLTIVHNNYICNGYICNLPNWGPTGGITLGLIADRASPASGIIFNTGGAFVGLFENSLGVGNTFPMVVSGPTVVEVENIGCPIIYGAGSVVNAYDSNFFNTQTFNGNSSGFETNCYIATGATAPIIYSSSGATSFSSMTIDSSAANVFTGAGAGAITIEGVDFIQSHGIAGTLTVGTGGGSRATTYQVGAGNVQVLSGTGIPGGSAPKGSLYLRTDGTTTNDRAYINTNGTTGWTAITTAT
jgi:hypothetical protein